MNGRERMRATNWKIRQLLKKDGYFDIEFFVHHRFFHDIFLLWDGIAKKPVDNKGNFELVWIQSSSSKKPKELHARIEEFCKLGHQKALLAELVKKEGCKVQTDIKLTKFGFGESI